MRITILFAAALTFSGCSKHSGSYEKMTATGTAEQAATLIAEATTLWDDRDDKASLEAALAKYEAAYRADPTNREAAIQLTRGWYWYGDVKVDTSENKLAAWDNAVQWGARCMAINNEFTDLLTKGSETERTAVKVMGAEDAGCLYWTASALGKWAKTTGFATLLKHKDTVKAYVTKVGELDGSYFFAGPDRYWGAYYAIAPSFAGGDLAKSQVHFNKSIADQPNYLGTKVLMANYLAVKQQDKALFDKLLNEVVSADANAIPELGPENRAEQVKAKALLEKKSDFFAN